MFLSEYLGLGGSEMKVQFPLTFRSSRCNSLWQERDAPRIKGQLVILLPQSGNRETGLLLNSLSPCVQFRTPPYGMVLPAFKMHLPAFPLPPQLTKSENPSQTYPAVCFHGDFKFCQTDDQDLLSQLVAEHL